MVKNGQKFLINDSKNIFIENIYFDGIRNCKVRIKGKSLKRCNLNVKIDDVTYPFVENIVLDINIVMLAGIMVTYCRESVALEDIASDSYISADRFVLAEVNKLSVAVIYRSVGAVLTQVKLNLLIVNVFGYVRV